MEKLFCKLRKKKFDISPLVSRDAALSQKKNFFFEVFKRLNFQRRNCEWILDYFFFPNHLSIIHRNSIVIVQI